MNVQLDELRPVPSAAEQAEAQRQLELRQQRQLAMSDTRRAHVLDAARRVFAERGVEGASIREIARAAGYTAGALYSYFDSKEAIYAALLAESLDRLQGEVAAARFAANGIVEWVPIRDAGNVAEARQIALRHGATPLGRVFALTSLPADGGLRLMASGGEALTLDLVPPSVAGRHYPQARRFAWSEPDTPMSYGFGAPAAEQMPGGLATLFATPWQ